MISSGLGGNREHEKRVGEYINADQNIQRNGTSIEVSSQYSTPDALESVLSTYNPNVIFEFNATQRCTRSFPSSSLSSGSINVDTPQNFDSVSAVISVCALNSSQSQRTIHESVSTISAVEQAQGFTLSTASILKSFSIYLDGDTKANPTTFEIRKSTYDGILLRPVTVTLPLNTPGWYEINLASDLFLQPGKYYIYMPYVKANEVNWMRSDTGSPGDAWVSGPWIQQYWNLTLKIRTQEGVNPQSVNMQIADRMVVNTGNGYGITNITATISSPTLILTVTNSTPILYYTQVNATYYDTAHTTNSVSLTEKYANWTLTVPFEDLGSNYLNYQTNFTGFQSDYSEIIGLNGTTEIQPQVSISNISFDARIDTVKFNSPNFITDVDCPVEIFNNQQVNFNVTSRAIGNISVNIYLGTENKHKDDFFGTSSHSFEWTVESNLEMGEYLFEALFFGENEIGVFHQNITLKKIARLCTYALSAFTFEAVKINYRFQDNITGISIPNASIDFKLGDIAGVLEQNLVDGNYSKNIDLRIFALLPGYYTLELFPSKTGYIAPVYSVPIIIMPRVVDLEISRSAQNLARGDTVSFRIQTKDQLSQDYLINPVSITFKIYKSGGDPIKDAIYTKTIKGIVWEDTLDWVVPDETNEGIYDVQIVVTSLYFTGNLILEDALIVKARFVLWPYLVGIAGAMVVFTFSYVQRKKTQSRHSVKGLIMMNQGGTILGERISNEFTKTNPHLISGAIAGVIMLIREITGKKLRTIQVEGGYLQIVQGSNYWLILLLQRSPMWIIKDILKMNESVETKFSKFFAKSDVEEKVSGEKINSIIRRFFGTTIEDSKLAISMTENTEAVLTQSNIDIDPEKAAESDPFLADALYLSEKDKSEKKIDVK